MKYSKKSYEERTEEENRNEIEILRCVRSYSGEDSHCGGGGVKRNERNLGRVRRFQRKMERVQEEIESNRMTEMYSTLDWCQKAVVESSDIYSVSLHYAHRFIRRTWHQIQKRHLFNSMKMAHTLPEVCFMKIPCSVPPAGLNHEFLPIDFTLWWHQRFFKSLLLAQAKIDKFKTSIDEKFTIEQVIADPGVLSTTLGTLTLFCSVIHPWLFIIVLNISSFPLKCSLHYLFNSLPSVLAFEYTNLQSQFFHFPIMCRKKFLIAFLHPKQTVSGTGSFMQSGKGGHLTRDTLWLSAVIRHRGHHPDLKKLHSGSLC